MKIMAALENPINIFFIIIMIVFFIWEIFSKKDFKSIIVSVGVLGTFVGIFIGLLDFDTHNLKVSISHILEGLKTAFLTSIVGMGFSIILSVIEKYNNNYESDDKEFQVLEEINEKLSTMLISQNNNDIITELNQLRLVNIDTKEEVKNIFAFSKTYNEEIKNILSSNFKIFNESLSLAIEHLSKGATEEIINALKIVIQDFNQELQSQFGENFVKLNESVINLLEWQENYKSSIKNTEQSLNTALVAIKDSETSLKEIETSQKNIHEVYKNLEEIIKTSKFEIDELNRHLETYKDLSSKSKDYFENLNEISTKFENLSQVILESVNTQQKSIENLVSHSLDEVKEYVSETKKSNEEMKENINKLFNDITNNIDNKVSKQSEIITDFVTNSIKKVIENFDKSNKELNLVVTHFKEIEQQIPNALGKSLDSLNSGLASLTRKFREDYETILNKYKKI